MGEVVTMASKVLVGRVRGHAYSAERLNLWVNEIWGNIFKDLPKVQTLPCGWFVPHFLQEEYTNWALTRYQHIEMAPIMLKRWSPLFDPEREQIGVGPLWGRLPRLPLQYWSEVVFVCIGNVLGTYLDYDKSYIKSWNKSLARILVPLDTREGLEEKITLQWKNLTRIQILDYEGVPFRCRKCPKVGHLFKEFSLVRKDSDSTKVPEGEAARAPTSAPGQTPPTASSMTKKGTPNQIPTSSTPRPSSPLMTRSRAAVEAARSLGTPPLPNFVFGFPPACSTLHFHTTSTSIQDFTSTSIPCPLVSHQPVLSTILPS